MSQNRIITHKIKRGSLIHFALDGIKRESFEVIKTELASLLKKRAGVYALYQNDKLVRVGLGTNIYWRLKGHSKSRKLVWNTASLFMIGADAAEVGWVSRKLRAQSAIRGAPDYLSVAKSGGKSLCPILCPPCIRNHRRW